MYFQIPLSLKHLDKFNEEWFPHLGCHLQETTNRNIAVVMAYQIYKTCQIYKEALLK